MGLAVADVYLSVEIGTLILLVTSVLSLTWTVFDLRGAVRELHGALPAAKLPATTVRQMTPLLRQHSLRLSIMKLCSALTAVSCVVMVVVSLTSPHEYCRAFSGAAAFCYVFSKFVVYLFMFTKARVVRVKAAKKDGLSWLETAVLVGTAGVLPFAVVCGVYVTGTAMQDSDLARRSDGDGFCAIKARPRFRFLMAACPSRRD